MVYILILINKILKYILIQKKAKKSSLKFYVYLIKLDHIACLYKYSKYLLYVLLLFSLNINLFKFKIQNLKKCKLFEIKKKWSYTFKMYFC